jgi:hypothetical protein
MDGDRNGVLFAHIDRTGVHLAECGRVAPAQGLLSIREAPIVVVEIKDAKVGRRGEAGDALERRSHAGDADVAYLAVRSLTSKPPCVGRNTVAVRLKVG